MKKRINSEVETNNSGWMVSFSDVVTLLITFFVLIISMSSMDQKVLKRSFTYFTGEPGSFKNEAKGGNSFLYFHKTYNLTLEDYKKLLNIISRYHLKEVQSVKVLKLEKILGEDNNIYDIVNNDVILKIKGNKIFMDFDYNFNENGLLFLKKLFEITDLFNNEILIECFYTDFPVKTYSIKNNVDLTIKRGVKIADKLIAKGISPERINISGWGDKKIKKDFIKIKLKDFLKI
jgi:chemotaxis protein MotB